MLLLSPNDQANNVFESKNTDFINMVYHPAGTNNNLLCMQGSKLQLHSRKCNSNLESVTG